MSETTDHHPHPTSTHQPANAPRPLTDPDLAGYNDGLDPAQDPTRRETVALSHKPRRRGWAPPTLAAVVACVACTLLAALALTIPTTRGHPNMSRGQKPLEAQRTNHASIPRATARVSTKRPRGAVLPSRRPVGLRMAPTPIAGPPDAAQPGRFAAPTDDSTVASPPEAGAEARGGPFSP
jgi:hypothetical protein